LARRHPHVPPPSDDYITSPPSLYAEVSEDGPLINGLRDQYELNEQLNVNCTSPSITPSIGSHQTKLSWQLNRQTVRQLDILVDDDDYHDYWCCVTYYILDIIDTSINVAGHLYVYRRKFWL
jgi:hypothetical protein